LLKPLLTFYYGAAIGAVLCMNGYNIGIDGSSLQHILKFDFFFVTISSLLFTVFLHWFSHARLLPTLSSLQGVPRFASPEEERKAFETLARFPRAVFLCVLTAGLLFSVGYHSLELFWFRFRAFDELVVRHLIAEQAFGVGLAFVYMSAVRRFLQPYVRRLSGIADLQVGQRSYVYLWMSAFLSALFITIIPQLWFVRNVMMRSDRPHMLTMAMILMITLLFAAAVMYMLFSHFQKELRGLTDAIGGLRRFGPLTQKRKLPVTGTDEIGQLAAIINDLQAKSAKEHEELQNDLRLAEAVQRMLLPDERRDFGSVRVRCYRETAKEVGGDFHDFLELPDGRIAVVFGEVSIEGAAAALMMSASVMLLRTELRGGGTAGEILTRLNVAIMDTTHGGLTVHLGLAIIDPSTCVIHYAGAGQASPFLLRKGEVTLLPAHAEPLGFAADTIYEAVSWRPDPGERLLFYSSGLMEQYHRGSAEENGIRTFRRLLEQVPAELALDDTMERILSQASPSAVRRDDMTLMISEFAGGLAKGERRYA
jgi:serine phosphatase RsbU (regulator of sigma subunit)